jgi:type III pantothenate kinase
MTAVPLPLGNRPLLAIDIGNTAIKLGYFEPASAGSSAAESEASDKQTAAEISAASIPSPKRILRVAPEEHDWDRIAAWLPPQSNLAAYVASVNRPTTQRLAEWMAIHLPTIGCQSLTRHDFPIRLDVEVPDRVGLDRVAGACAAARVKSPERSAIIVDAGSAITVDWVSAEGAFCGGAILPGWQTMARALTEKTDLLPLVAQPLATDAIPPPLGRSTEAAIRSGLFWGSVGAVRELIARLAADHDPAPELFLAGGDLTQLAPHLPVARYEANLVLQGIAIAGQLLDA